MEASILIVSPVRNEAAHIEEVVRAVERQELAPARWIVADDSSEDQTVEILRRLQPQVPFMTVLESETAAAEHVRDRLADGAAPRNFNRALATIGPGEFTHIMKLDGDIELPPSYLRILMERFAADPLLGIAGGVVGEPRSDGGLRTLKTPRIHVHGALKCYSLVCFEAIGGLQERLGWDTIDGTYARMRGFRTHSFTDLVAIHHRPAGSAQGTLRGRARHGECAYIAHQTPSWVALRSLKYALARPWLLSGVCFLYGYLRAASRRIEQVGDAEYRKFTRRELRRRTYGALLPRH